MNLPVGYAARLARPADVDAIVAMHRAGDLLLVGEPDTPRDMIEEAFSSPFVDPARDLWVVEDPAGVVVASAEVRAVDPRSSVDAFVRVHPKHTGCGLATGLLDLAEARARERLGPGDRIGFRATADPTDRAGVALLRDRGGTHVRSFWHMQRELDGAREPVEPPDGMLLRGFDPEASGEWATFHEVLETSFRDHFGFEPLELGTFVAMWEGMPTFDPSLVTFAEADGDVVGVVVSVPTAIPGLGWLSDVGVLPAYRGRGLAKALLRRAFADLAARGLDRVRLNVDSANVTGATKLYERVGMHVHREWAVFNKPLEGGH